jgi:hypothetical protein
MTTLRAASLLFALSYCTLSHAQSQTSISPLAQAIVTPASDRLPGELQLVREAVIAAGGSLESDLITAFNVGPSSNTVAAIATSEVAEFTNIQTWLSANGASAGIDSATITSILSQTPQQLAQSEANLYAFRYKSNAVTYLAPIAGPKGHALLTSIAANSKSPFQSIAQAAIANSFGSLGALYEAVRAPTDKFALQAVAVLGPGANVNPVTSDAIIRLGTFVALVPGGSFTAQSSNVYTFSGIANILGGGTVNLTMAIAVISPLPRLAKQFGPTLVIGVEGNGVDLSSLTAPVQAGLMFGSTGGTTTALKL